MEKSKTYTPEEIEHYSSSVNKATADLNAIASVLRVFNSNYGFDSDALTPESENRIKNEWNDIVNVLAHVRSSVENVADFLNTSLC